MSTNLLPSVRWLAVTFDTTGSEFATAHSPAQTARNAPTRNSHKLISLIAPTPFYTFARLTHSGKWGRPTRNGSLAAAGSPPALGISTTRVVWQRPKIVPSLGPLVG